MGNGQSSEWEKKNLSSRNRSVFRTGRESNYTLEDSIIELSGNTVSHRVSLVFNHGLGGFIEYGENARSGEGRASGKSRSVSPMVKSTSTRGSTGGGEK